MEICFSTMAKNRLHVLISEIKTVDKACSTLCRTVLVFELNDVATTTELSVTAMTAAPVSPAFNTEYIMSR